MYRIKYLLLLLFLLPSVAHAADYQDPCSVLPKSTVVINFTTTGANTTSLVALVTGKSVYVCGFSADIPTSGTSAATLQFEYGTGGTCVSGATALTGTFGAGYATAGAPVLYNYGDGTGTIFSTPASNALCMVTGGTTVNIQGFVSYVQN